MIYQDAINAKPVALKSASSQTCVVMVSCTSREKHKNSISSSLYWVFVCVNIRIESICMCILAINGVAIKDWIIFTLYGSERDIQVWHDSICFHCWWCSNVNTRNSSAICYNDYGYQVHLFCPFNGVFHCKCVSCVTSIKFSILLPSLMRKYYLSLSNILIITWYSGWWCPQQIYLN